MARAAKNSIEEMLEGVAEHDEAVRAIGMRQHELLKQLLRAVGAEDGMVKVLIQWKRKL